MKKKLNRKKKAAATPEVFQGVAATPDPNNPWMLVKKNGHNDKCQCYNTNSLIPNLQTWTTVDNFQNQRQCKKQLKHCKKF